MLLCFVPINILTKNMDVIIGSFATVANHPVYASFLYGPFDFFFYLPTLSNELFAFFVQPYKICPTNLLLLAKNKMVT